jgi:Chaperone of endosialidase/Secretion system C-terminal sorting domain
MKTNLKLITLAIAAIGLNQNGSAQNWVQGGNNVSLLQSNNLGTTAAAANKNLNIITNGVSRFTFSGTTFSSVHRGNSLLLFNTDVAGIAKISSGKASVDLGLFAAPNDCSVGTVSNIIAAAQNIFMQSKNVIPGGYAPVGPSRVFIGEFTTFVPNPSTPKLLVRGAGKLDQDPNCLSPGAGDADNIGLVSGGTFGEAVTAPVKNRWLALGTRPSTTAGFNSYGFRTQWNNTAGDLTVQENVRTGQNDVALIWQDGTTLLDVTDPTFNSANFLQIQFRNGQLPSGTDPRYTAARYSMNSGAARLDLFGTAFINGVAITSDSRLKKDILPMTNATEIIRQLRPVTYNYKTDEFKEFGLPRTFQYGFLAQEVEKVMPSAVLESSTGYKANYTMLIPVLTNALQDALKKIDELDAKLTANTSQNRSLLNLNSAENLDLNNQFYQNKPNPFSDMTTISYNFINDGQYQIVVSDLTGKRIKTFTNLQKTGEVKITKDDLPSAGIYLYTLISSNGEILGSKQMMFEK